LRVLEYPSTGRRQAIDSQMMMLMRLTGGGHKTTSEIVCVETLLLLT
jgi:hypothetical protein